MTRADKLLLLLLCGACMLAGCPEIRTAERPETAECLETAEPAADTADSESADGTPGRRAFRLPDVPEALRDPADRADYLALHYWDCFDFADTVLLSCPEITEQAFVDFLSVLPHAREAAAAVDTLYSRAAVRSEALYCFIGLGDKYLYEPNSPMCDEELYILVLRALTANPRIGEADKLRPRRLLETVSKNRPGDKAADFEFLGRDGVKRRMSHLKAEYTLLCFYDPSCDECGRVKGRLAASPAVCGMVGEGRLAVLSVNVAGDSGAWRDAAVPEGWTDGCDVGERLVRGAVYDLKAMPTLYLLDREKRVLLKDTSVGRLEAKLAGADF